jgi:hypothetical protein
MPGQHFPDTAEYLEDCRQLYWHTVPIINYDRGQPSVVGSGVFAVVDEFHFVFSAAHVFEPAFRNVAFGHLGSDGFEVFGADNMKILTAKAQNGTGEAQRAVYKDGLDLAVIEPTPDVLDRLRSIYRPFDLRQTLFPSSAWGVLSGWPARKNIYDSRKQKCYFDTCYHIQCPVADLQRLRQADWNPDVFLGLSVDKAKDFVSATSGHHIHLPNLEGVSGAGFWMRSSAVEEPHPTSWSLVGIVVEDHESKRMLKAIKIEHVWAPLRQGWGLTKTT